MTATIGQPDGTTVWYDLAALIGRIFLNAWFVMLTLGVLHASASTVPALGYWNSVLTVAVLTSVIWISNFGIMQRVRTLTPLYGRKVKPADLSETVEKLLNASRTRSAGTN